MKIPERISEQVLLQFCEAYNKRNLSNLLNLFTENANLWGTALDEYRVGSKELEEQFKRDWQQSEKSELITVSIVPTLKDTFWTAGVFNAKVTVQGQEHLFEHLRITIAIEKEMGVAKISHMHASFPDYRNAENSSFPLMEV